MKNYKCKSCKEIIDNNLIKIDGKPNKYYHQDCYTELEYYKKLKDLIFVEFFQYTYPTVITKNLTELNRTIKYEYLYKYLNGNLKVIQNKINQMEFVSAIQRWNYILAILRNNIEHFIKTYIKLSSEKSKDLNIIEASNRNINNNSANFDILD